MLLSQRQRAFATPGWSRTRAGVTTALVSVAVCIVALLAGAVTVVVAIWNPPVTLSAPECVFAALRSGIVAPLVPVLMVALVPSPRLVRAAAAVIAPVPPD